MTTLTPRQTLQVVVTCALALLCSALPAAPRAQAATTARAVAITADPLGPGFWILYSDGRVVGRGSARGHASAPAAARTSAIATYPTGKGLWRAKRNGATRAFGAATTTAPRQTNRNAPIVGIAPHYRGQGFWRVTARGQAFATGASQSYGRVRTSERIRAVAGHPEAAGYWALDRLGRVYGFGASRVLGEPAGAGATGIAAHPSGNGYWVVRSNGRVSAYGASAHHGDARLDSPVVDIAAAPDGAGYWVLARDGRVRRFGSARAGMISTSGPPKPELVTVGGITVASTIAADVKALLSAAKAAGINYGGGGYRSYDVQVYLRQQHCGVRYYDVFVKSSSQCSPMTAVPGRSMHERGLAIDFHQIKADGSIGAIAGTRAFRWLKNNAAKYGLYNLPSEPWHWSTTGG